MERVREARRGGNGTPPVSAPRRPRTTGFKDAPVAEDVDEMVDDVHNPRLRERSRKDNNSTTAGQVVSSASLGYASRNKRKRQASQEMQGQARSSALDDSYETTEDTEVGLSEDDDDPPPPPIPRRPAKLRLQGKIVDDGFSADLPAVPRKARTAILKRPQELSPPVVDAPSQKGSIGISRSLAPIIAPSYTSTVSLRPGRRTKFSGSKPRAVKVPKVSPSTVISEQEVEVVEALFDLARMLTGQPISFVDEDTSTTMKLEMNIEPEAEPEVKSEPEVLASKIPVMSSLQHLASCPKGPVYTGVSLPVSLSHTSAHTLLGYAVPSSPIAMPSASHPATSGLPVPPVMVTPTMAPPCPTAALPPAEAPKRKWPRVRARSDDVGSTFEVCRHENNSALLSSSSGLFVSPSTQQPEQILTGSAPITDKVYAKPDEGPSTALPKNMFISGTHPPSTLFLCEPFESVSPTPVDINKTRKVEGSGSSSPPQKHIMMLDRKAASTDVALSPTFQIKEMEQHSNNVSRNESLTKLEPGERPSQLPGSASDRDQSTEFDIDLMAPPLVKSGLSPVRETATVVSGNTPGNISEEGYSDLPVIATVGVVWPTGDKERGRGNEPGFTIQRADRGCQEQGREKGDDRRCQEQGREKERDGDYVGATEYEMQRDQDEKGGMAKEGNNGKDQDRTELGNQHASQRLVKSLKLDSRVPKMERPSPIDASLSLLALAPPVASTTATNVFSSVATLPLSVGMIGWPPGLSPISYYGSVPGSVWPSAASFSEIASAMEKTPSAQLQHPYVVQAHQSQTWKRCASHVYIAHFIDVQQQMNRHPFVQASYRNSSNLYGSKPYNLNIPLSPVETLFGSGSGGPFVGGVSGTATSSVSVGGVNGLGLGVIPTGERHLGLPNSQARDILYMEAFSVKQTGEQSQASLQPSPNVSLQAGPGLGFPATQAATTAAGCVAVLANGVPVGNPGSSCVSTIGPGSSSTSALVAGTGSGNGGIAGHAGSQAQYLQAVMQQGGFHFPFQATPHYSHGFNVSPIHSPHQTAQFFSSPFYTTHLVHSPALPSQQVQQTTNTSTGAGSLQRHHSSQPSVRNFPPGSPQQEQSSQIPSSQSPSHLQHLHAQVSTSEQIHRHAEREVDTAGESSSTADSKFPILQRNMHSQRNTSLTVLPLSSSPSLVHAGGMQSVSQDFNLLATVGGKQAMQQQATLVSQHSPRSHVSAHHHASGSTLQLGLKAVDQQPSRIFSGISIHKGSAVGPGPLGLSPVAAVMAPQGHTLMQTMADSSGGHAHHQLQHHQSVMGQSLRPLQSGQQQQRAMQTQRVSSGMSSVGDSRTTVVDGSTFSSTRSVRETVEERKLSIKRGMSSNSSLIRVDLDTPAAVQGSATGGALPTSRITATGGPTLNLMTSTSGVVISRPSGRPCGVLQQAGSTTPANQNSKPGGPRNKFVGIPVGPTSATPNQCQLALPDGPTIGPALSNKVSSTPLSLPGPNVAQSSQVPRQIQVPHLSQLKLSGRVLSGPLSSASAPAPQTVLAAAIAKSQQGSHLQQSRPQAQLGSSTGPPPRLPPVSLGVTSTSLPPLPLASKSAMTSTGKGNSSKGSFTLSHKISSGIAVKRSVAVSGPHVSPILGSSPLTQNLPLKASQQQQQGQNQLHSLQLPQLQQQNMSRHHMRPSQQPPPQSVQQPQSHPPQSLTLAQQQYHHQQVHLNSQQLQVHNAQVVVAQQQQSHQIHHIFIQNPAFQQHQQSPGSPLSLSPKQPPGVHQQPLQHLSQQLHQQASSPSQPQQPQQPQQSRQHNIQGGSGSFVGSVASGVQSFGTPFPLGTGSNGNNGSSLRPLISEGSVGSWVPGSSLTNNNITVGSGTPLQNSSSQRSHDEMSGLEQGNGMHLNLSSISSGMPQMPLSGSPSLQPILNRTATVGTSLGKSMGAQLAGSDYPEGIGSRGGFTLAVPHPGLSSGNSLPCSNLRSNCSSNSCVLTPNATLGSEGRPSLGGPSLVNNEGTVLTQGHIGPVHQSSLTVAPGASSNSGQNGQPGILGQTSTSVLQP